MDSIDYKVLLLLQQNARISNAEIARQVGIAPSTALRRTRNLEACGIIQGYEARIDPEAAGFHLLAYVFVAINHSSRDSKCDEMLTQMKGVQEVHYIAGEDCFLVKIRVPDLRSLSQLLRSHLSAPLVRSIRVTIVLETIQETAGLRPDWNCPACSPHLEQMKGKAELVGCSRHLWSMPTRRNGG